MIPVTVIRHPKERLSKCSLTPLQGRDDITFIKAGPALQFDAEAFTVLAVGAPELSPADAGRPFLLLDSTWRLLPDIERCLVNNGTARSLPAVETAYPRVSKIAADPVGGLASVEALYFAKLLLGERDDSLLEKYFWKDAFVEILQRHGYLSAEKH